MSVAKYRNDSGLIEYHCVVIGMPQHGKTVRAKRRVDELVRAGFWCWISDPNNAWKGWGHEWPDSPTFIREATRTGRVHPIARFRGDPAELIGIQPYRPNDTKNRHPHIPKGQPLPGGVAEWADYGRRPTAIVFDEASLLEGDKEVNLQVGQLCVRRAHLGLAPMFLIQYPTQVPKVITRTACDFDLLRTEDLDDLQTLKRRGVPEAVTSQLPHLPPLHGFFGVERRA